MIFYESFFEAIKNLPDNERLQCYDALIQYGITGTVPEGLDAIPHMVFILSRPLIDANRKRGAVGALGGRPRKKPEEKPAAIEKADAVEAMEELPLVDPDPEPPEPPDEPEQPDKQEKPENTKKAAEKKAADAMFNRLWQQYPNKRGAGRISDTKKLILYKIGEEHLRRALNRYMAEHEQKARQSDFVPQWQNGSTWFNTGYIDYLDENYSESPPDTKPQRDKVVRNRFNNFEQREQNYDDIARQIMQSQEMI